MMKSVEYVSMSSTLMHYKPLCFRSFLRLIFKYCYISNKSFSVTAGLMGTSASTSWIAGGILARKRPYPIPNPSIEPAAIWVKYSIP